jgi:hypothetical protein
MSDRRKGDRRGVNLESLRKANQDYLLSDVEVALLAAVPVNTVRKWRQVGMLPFVKVGRHPRVWLSEFQRTFHQPKPNGSWEQIPGSGKMPPAGNIRRKL